MSVAVPVVLRREISVPKIEQFGFGFGRPSSTDGPSAESQFRKKL